MLRPILSIGAAMLATMSATAVAAQTASLSVVAFPATGSVRLAHEGHAGAAQASGTVNAVDIAHRTVNLSHGSIKALGWPAMTMDFPTGPDVDFAALQPGMRVSFTLVRGPSGMVVDTIRPIGNGQ